MTLPSAGIRISRVTRGPGVDAFVTAPLQIPMPRSSDRSVHGQTDVAINTVLTVRYSEPIDLLELRAGGLVLRSDATFQPLATTVSLSADGRTATFAPLEALVAGQTYWFFASSGGNARDLAGNVVSDFGRALLRHSTATRHRLTSF